MSVICNYNIDNNTLVRVKGNKSKSVVVIPKAMREQTLIACDDDVGHIDAKKNSLQFTITFLVAKQLPILSIPWYGPLNMHLSDKGTAFTARHTQQFLQKYGITQSTTTTHSPQANSIVKQANDTVLLKVSIVTTQYSTIIFIAPPHTITMY
ncbi:hypothetical protein TNCV_4729201 [Trichonephila clavipes]|nr:hypothetical protein TNCV_4729201 [Trichonephila clavipes]